MHCIFLANKVLRRLRGGNAQFMEEACKWFDFSLNMLKVEHDTKPRNEAFWSLKTWGVSDGACRGDGFGIDRGQYRGAAQGAIWTPRCTWGPEGRSCKRCTKICTTSFGCLFWCVSMAVGRTVGSYESYEEVTVPLECLQVSLSTGLSSIQWRWLEKHRDNMEYCIKERNIGIYTHTYITYMNMIFIDFWYILVFCADVPGKHK